MRCALVYAAVVLLCRFVVSATFTPILAADTATSSAAASPDDLDPSASPLRSLIERYTADLAALRRFYDVPFSPQAGAKRTEYYGDWLKRLDALDFNKLDEDGRIDYLLLHNELRYQLRHLDHDGQRRHEMRFLIPFAETIVALEQSRRRMDPVEPQRAAQRLVKLSEQIAELRRAIDKGDLKASRNVAFRAAQMVDRLRGVLERWNRFSSGYDPQFSWWVAKPLERAKKDLSGYAAVVREKLAGVKPNDKETIVGDPIGRAALLSELEREMIAYTPEELIEIAEQEFAWCEAERRRAAEEMGFGDDWRQALEHVKSLHVAPGKQPQLIKKLAHEAVAFLDQRDLVTIPPLCRQSWRMEMMSPDRQRVSPYFTGGEVISVSFPTSDMSHADKLMSMRGNNIHFSRATVHHELIPGHHLQGFMAARYRTHRRLFRTPFLVEGWALYWEMLLWDLDFCQSPEDRIGMLFWRSHRCARIIFSLNFHLGNMTANEAVDFLVQRVGHERRNATAEVRRSVAGSYGPLYQAAYMLGGLQIRSIRRDLVETGKLTDRQFHDAILKENSIPIDMVRASLTKQPLTRDYRTSWRFYDPADAVQ